jgi:hypothetical protein
MLFFCDTYCLAPDHLSRRGGVLPLISPPLLSTKPSCTRAWLFLVSTCLIAFLVLSLMVYCV